jgi:hypothetical protein
MPHQGAWQQTADESITKFASVRTPPPQLPGWGAFKGHHVGISCQCGCCFSHFPGAHEHWDRPQLVRENNKKRCSRAPSCRRAWLRGKSSPRVGGSGAPRRASRAPDSWQDALGSPSLLSLDTCVQMTACFLGSVLCVLRGGAGNSLLPARLSILCVQAMGSP